MGFHQSHSFLTANCTTGQRFPFIIQLLRTSYNFYLDVGSQLSLAIYLMKNASCIKTFLLTFTYYNTIKSLSNNYVITSSIKAK